MAISKRVAVIAKNAIIFIFCNRVTVSGKDDFSEHRIE